MSGAPGGTARRSPLVTLAERMLSHSSIFAAGTGMAMVLAAVRLAVLTRLLEMSVYGQLTLLIVMAGFVATLSRIAIVTGSLRAAFRGGDEEGIDDEDEGADSGDDPRRMLTTGLVGSILLAAVLTAAVAAFAQPVDEMLIDTGAWFPIVAATLLGGLDGSFRLVSMIARFERRPLAYVVLQLVHGIAGLAAAAVLIEAGYGLEGAIGGLALGSALALIPGTWTIRHRLSLAVDFGHLGTLAKLGAPMAGIILGRFLFQYADVFMVSRYMPEDDVALYRVAGRIGGVAASAVGGVLFAWGPLMRGPLRGALHREGTLVTAGAGLLTYFWLAAAWLIVSLVLMRDLLIRLAPPEYGQVAYLIAALGVAALSLTGLIVVHRTSGLKRKMLVLTALLVGMSPVLIGLAALLVPRFGLDGAAAAAIATPLLSAAGYLAVSQRVSSKPLDLPWRRLLLTTFVGAAYCALVLLIAGRIGAAGVWLSVAAAPLFPFALVLSGALPREDARTVVRVLARLPRQGASRLADGLMSLDDQDLEVLDALLRDRRAPSDVARAIDQDEDELMGRLVFLLREVGEIGPPRPADNLIGRYLLSSANVNLRDREGHLLALERGVDSMEVDELTALSDRITKLSEKRWLALTGRDAAGGQVD